ncbi:MAG: hypothetical protein ACM3MJ_01395 [Deltaproteobacteria bacterium]
MRRALLPLAIGCVLVGVVAIVLAIVGWSWGWFVLANGALAVLLLMLFRGSVTGADPDRPPGVARVSAARAAGPFDPGTLSAQEGALYPDPDPTDDARADDLATGFAFLGTAVAPAAAAVLAAVLRL